MPSEYQFTSDLGQREREKWQHMVVLIAQYYWASFFLQFFLLVLFSDMHCTFYCIFLDDLGMSWLGTE